MNRIAYSTSRGALLVLALLAPGALAESADATKGHEGAGGVQEHVAHVANWWSLGAKHADAPALGWLTITFLIFVIGLVVLLRPQLRMHLENRSDRVQRAIEEATRAKQLAEQKARDAQAKLAALDSEMIKLRADFEEQGRAEAVRMDQLAAQTAARIQKDAEDTINAERDRATLSLRAEASRLALEMAEERIKGALTGSDDARLQQQLLKHLEQ